MDRFVVRSSKQTITININKHSEAMESSSTTKNVPPAAVVGDNVVPLASSSSPSSPGNLSFVSEVMIPQ